MISLIVSDAEKDTKFRVKSIVITSEI